MFGQTMAFLGRKTPFNGIPKPPVNQPTTKDIACVHQTDAELRERGVYGIGGWLAVSCFAKSLLSSHRCLFFVEDRQITGGQVELSWFDFGPPSSRKQLFFCFKA